MKEVKIPIKIEHIQHLLNDGAFALEFPKSKVGLYFYMEEPKGYVVIKERGQTKIVINPDREVQ